MNPRRIPLLAGVVLGAALLGLVPWCAGRRPTLPEPVAPVSPASPGLSGSAASPVAPVAPEAEEPARDEPRAASEPEPARRPAPADTPGADAAAAVFGTLRDTDGGALEGAVVVVRDAAGVSLRGVLENGGYRLEGLEPGDHWLTVSARGMRPLTQLAAALEAGEQRRVDLTLSPLGRIEIELITPEGERPALDFVGFGPRQPGLEPYAVASDEPLGERFVWRIGGTGNPFGLGRFLSDPDQDSTHLGTLELFADPPLHVSLVAWEHVLTERFVLEPVERLTFVLDPAALESRLGSVRFRVVTRTALPDTTLWLPGAGSLDVPLAPDGSGQVGRLPPGRYTLQAATVALRLGFALEPGQALDLGELRVDERRRLHCRLRLPDGSRPELGPEEEPSFVVFGHTDPGTGETRLDPTYRLGASLPEFELELLPGAHVLQWIGSQLVSRPARVELGERDGELELEVQPRAALTLAVERGQRPGLCYLLDDGQGVELARGALPAAPRRVETCQGALRLRITDLGGALLLQRALWLGPDGLRVGLEL